MTIAQEVKGDKPVFVQLLASKNWVSLEERVINSIGMYVCSLESAQIKFPWAYKLSFFL